MTSKKGLQILTGVLALAGIGTIILSQKQASATTAPATPAAVAPSASGLSGWIAAPGRVEPVSEEVKLGAELDGRLDRVLVDEGDTVRRGQVLALLVNGDYQARVALARAEVAQREAQLERLRNGSRREERDEAEAQLREAEAQLKTAQAEHARRATLLDRGAISQSEYDLTGRDQATAKARVDALRQRLALVRDETRVEDLRRAEAEVAAAKASLSEAQALLEKTYIRAPMDGRILRRWRKSGESVAKGGETPILSLGDFSRLRVRVDVDENDVAKLYLGQTAWVKANAYGERKFTGHVVRIGQELGRKNVRTDEPNERVDKKILETLVDLDPGQNLPSGLRVDAYLQARK